MEASLIMVTTDPIVVIAGSRALPPGIAARLVIRFLADLPFGAVVRLRGPMPGRVPGVFEQVVGEVCDVIGVEVEWHRPNPTPERPGRKSVWDRDQIMLADASVVLCFYDVGQIGDEESGTVALVDKAIDLDTPVYAYALTPDDEVIRVGEHDRRDLWGQRAPRP